MRTFRLVRDQDVSGVSGTGVVAEGIEFSDGVVALRWLVPPGVPGHGYPTSVVFHDQGIESVEKIHGHSGATRIEFADLGECEDEDCTHPARVCLGHALAARLEEERAKARLALAEVSITRDQAQAIARLLRDAYDGNPVPERTVMERLADMLDPPPSLRDEVLATVKRYDTSVHGNTATDAVLAVVRRHVEALPGVDTYDGELLGRDTVLRLLGGGDD